MNNQRQTLCFNTGTERVCVVKTPLSALASQPSSSGVDEPLQTQFQIGALLGSEVGRQLGRVPVVGDAFGRGGVGTQVLTGVGAFLPV